MTKTTNLQIQVAEVSFLSFSDRLRSSAESRAASHSERSQFTWFRHLTRRRPPPRPPGWSILGVSYLVGALIQTQDLLDRLYVLVGLRTTHCLPRWAEEPGWWKSGLQTPVTRTWISGRKWMELCLCSSGETGLAAGRHVKERKKTWLSKIWFAVSESQIIWICWLSQQLPVREQHLVGIIFFLWSFF